MNKVLDRQIKQFFGDRKNVPSEIEPFLQLIDRTYDARDEERLLAERSFDLSSKELNELNEKLRQETLTMRENMLQLERLNNLMVNRELKMIELKQQITELQRKLGTH